MLLSACTLCFGKSLFACLTYFGSTMLDGNIYNGLALFCSCFLAGELRTVLDMLAVFIQMELLSGSSNVYIALGKSAVCIGSFHSSLIFGGNRIPVMTKQQCNSKSDCSDDADSSLGLLICIFVRKGKDNAATATSMPILFQSQNLTLFFSEAGSIRLADFQSNAPATTQIKSRTIAPIINHK